MSTPLQFEHAEFSAPAGAESCGQCHGPAAPQYYALNGKVFCSGCRDRIEASLDKVRGSGRLGRAFLYGLGAAVAGSLVFYGVSALTGFQFGLIAVVIGWAVGKAVRKGSQSLGGRRYQIMAVLLTYFSIASTNIFPILKYLSERPHKTQISASATPISSLAPVQRPQPSVSTMTAGILLLFGLALAMPILSITHNFLGIIIIGIGLWEAWKFTRAIKIEFTGPFTVTPAA